MNPMLRKPITASRTERMRRLALGLLLTLLMLTGLALLSPARAATATPTGPDDDCAKAALYVGKTYTLQVNELLVATPGGVHEYELLPVWDGQRTATVKRVECAPDGTYTVHVQMASGNSGYFVVASLEALDANLEEVPVAKPLIDPNLK